MLSLFANVIENVHSVHFSWTVLVAIKSVVLIDAWNKPSAAKKQLFHYSANPFRQSLVGEPTVSMFRCRLWPLLFALMPLASLRVSHCRLTLGKAAFCADQLEGGPSDDGGSSSGHSSQFTISKSTSSECVHCSLMTTFTVTSALCFSTQQLLL